MTDMIDFKKNPTVIDGKAIAAMIRSEIAQEVSQATAQGIRPPGLAVILIGDNPASHVYVRNKEAASNEVGFHSIKINEPANITQFELLDHIRALNHDPSVDGILCQFPLPPGLDEQEVTLALDPEKDVDGFHPVNMGRLAMGLPGFVPCTPLGCKELLKRSHIETQGQHIVILGRSNVVGMPMALLMMAKNPHANATVTVLHSKSKAIPQTCAQADILIAAIGRPQFVKEEFIKKGATVIDVGINRIEDPTKKSGVRLVGDVDFDSVINKAGAITPVPGGVGPMTIAMLLANTLSSWRKRIRR